MAGAGVPADRAPELVHQPGALYPVPGSRFFENQYCFGLYFRPRLERNCENCQGGRIKSDSPSTGWSRELKVAI